MPGDCLLIIDMQNDFLDKLEDDRRARLISKTNQLISTFRDAGCQIIWIRQVFKPDLSDAYLKMQDQNISVVIDGTRGAEIHSDLAVQEGDSVLIKKRYSAFFGTDLERLLSDLGPDRITLAGVNTHACIRTTAIDAYQRDMRVVVASDCIESYDLEHARISVAYMDRTIGLVMTNAEISSSLK